MGDGSWWIIFFLVGSIVVNWCCEMLWRLLKTDETRYPLVVSHTASLKIHIVCWWFSHLRPMLKTIGGLWWVYRWLPSSNQTWFAGTWLECSPFLSVGFQWKAPLTSGISQPWFQVDGPASLGWLVVQVGWFSWLGDYLFGLLWPANIDQQIYDHMHMILHDIASHYMFTLLVAECFK